MYRNNIEMIRGEGIRVVQGRIPCEVRKELMQGVKNKEIVRFPKKKLLPEVFCRPDKANEAQKARIQIALDSVKRIANIVS